MAWHRLACGHGVTVVYCRFRRQHGIFCVDPLWFLFVQKDCFEQEFAGKVGAGQVVLKASGQYLGIDIVILSTPER